MTAIRDLDLLTSEPIEVKLAGWTFKLPADCPIPLILKVEKAKEAAGSEDPEEAEKALLDIYAEILALFRVHQPDLDSVPISTTQMLLFLPLVYGASDEDEGPADPPTKPTAKKRTGKTAAKSRSTS